MTPTHPAPSLAEMIADRVCLRVCELPDRTSPDDWPEALLVTSNELHAIVREEVAAWLARPETVQRMADALARFDGGPCAREDIEAYAEYCEQARAAIAAAVGEAPTPL